MLNLNEEFKNHMSLYCMAKRILSGKVENPEEAWLNEECIFRLTPGAVSENRGITRALAAVAWGFWYGADPPEDLPYGIPRPEETAVLPVPLREQKVIHMMEEWFETLQEAYTEAFTKKSGTSGEKEVEKRLFRVEMQRRQMSGRRIGYNRENYISILHEAVSFGARICACGSLLSAGDPEEICLPVRILRQWFLREQGAKAAPLRLLLYLYYHYAPKDDEGNVLMYATDFGLWASDTAKFYEVYRSQIMKKDGKLPVPACEIKLGTGNLNSSALLKMWIEDPDFLWEEQTGKQIEKQKWEKENSCESAEENRHILRLRDNGERGLVRALTCLYLLPKCRMEGGLFQEYKPDSRVFAERFKVIGEAYRDMSPDEKEACDRELLLWAEAASDPVNWNHRTGRMTAPCMRLLPQDPKRRVHVDDKGQHILYITEEQVRQLECLQKR